MTSLIVAFKSARSKYEEAKRDSKKAKEISEQENLANQIGFQINQLKSKVACIKQTLAYLDNEFTECVFDAENKAPAEQSKLIAKATAPKRKSNDKSKEIKELEEQIKVLETKRKKV